MNEQQLFAYLGKQLEPDGDSALAPLRLAPWKPETGPFHKVQFVIEIAGSNLIPGDRARELLEPTVRASFGEPEVYVMAPGERRWRPLWSGDNSITFDSMALAWDFVTSSGKLTAASASELWKRAEQYASALGRRAFPLPPPEDAAKAADNLEQVRDALDIGVDVLLRTLEPRLDLTALVVAAYEVGFRMGSSGVLEWRQSGWPEPLLTILPDEGDEVFGVDAPIRGVDIGFTVPCSPDPEQSLERLFTAAERIGAKMDLPVLTEEGEPLSESAKNNIRKMLAAALDTFDRIQLKPGSAEALRLFEP